MKIGQLADATGATAKTLRFYEDSGLLPPAKRAANGYRDYPPEAVARVSFIHRGQAAGLTLAQIRQILDIRDSGTAPCGHVRHLLDTRLSTIDDQITQLTGLRDTISELRRQAEAVDPTACDPAQVCTYL